MAAKLTLAVLQAADMLGLYGAELARILNVLCSVVSLMSNGKKLLETDSKTRDRGLRSLEFYELLGKTPGHHEADMHHWLRVEHKQLQKSPLLEMVDHNGLRKVMNCLKDKTP